MHLISYSVFLYDMMYLLSRFSTTHSQYLFLLEYLLVNASLFFAVTGFVLWRRGKWPLLFLASIILAIPAITKKAAKEYPTIDREWDISRHDDSMERKVRSMVGCRVGSDNLSA